MRYPAAEKLEIIRLVEQSHLPTRQTLEKLGIPRRTFARWYARYLDGGPEALEDRPSAPSRVWNRLPENVRKQIIDMALEESDALSHLALPSVLRCQRGQSALRALEVQCALGEAARLLVSQLHLLGVDDGLDLDKRRGIHRFG